MAIGKARAIDYKKIYNEIDQLTLAKVYLGVNKLPILINSPLRKDKNASFGLYVREDKVNYKDFATNEGGNILKLLKQLWNFNDYYDVAKKIYNDFNGDNIEIREAKKTKIYRAKDSKIEVKVRPWKQHDLDYWTSYGVSKEFLDMAEIFPISNQFVTKDGNTYIYGADKYAYVFVEHKDDKTTIKIYQPFNQKGFKWLSKHDGSVISLWTKIPKKGNSLVICSSTKDALCLWCNTGIPCIAPQGEGYTLKESVIKELKNRFTNIYILYDNDEPGIKDGELLAQKTGFKNLILPKFKGGKDVSDLYKTVGKQKFLKIIVSLLDKPKQLTLTF